MSGRDNDPNTAQAKPVLPTNEARQGVSGHNVRYVLAIGTGLVIVLFAILYIWYFSR